MIRPPEPVKLLLTNNCEEKHEDACMICLVELDSAHHKMAACGHCFHLDCISQWAIEGRSNCPSCRSDVKMPVKTIQWRKGQSITIKRIR